MINKQYYCYSYPLKNFLIISGLKMVGNGFHLNTKKKYWVFNRCNKLDQLLTEWQMRNH